VVKTLDEIRREYILMILEDNGWDVKKASGILRISESRLQREIQKLTKPSAKRKGRSKA
jgi:DNA-binding NtrC family response regulator